MVPCLWSFFFPGSIMETNSHNGLQNRNGCAWYEASTQIYVFECVNTHLPLVHHEDALQLPALMAVGCGVIQTAALVQCPQQSPPPLAERSGNYFKFKSSVHAQQGILWRSMKNKQNKHFICENSSNQSFFLQHPAGGSEGYHESRVRGHFKQRWVIRLHKCAVSADLILMLSPLWAQLLQ